MAILKMGGGIGMHPNRMLRCFMLLVTGFLVYYFTMRFAFLVSQSNTSRRTHHSRTSVQGTVIFQQDQPLKDPEESVLLAATQSLAHPIKGNVNGSSLPKVFSGSNIHRIVHLDLKGAPPSLDYFKKIFPKLREWGATGLLIEYEDMFPYSGKLKVLARPNAYNTSTITEMLKLADQNDLLVIPLIQTFGHLEFVLKHSQFKYLREVDSKMKNLNPAHKEALPLVKEMVNQVLTLHPNIKYLHIGCDEVYYLGFSRESMAMMNHQYLDEKGLFMYHVKRILNFIHETHPQIKPIMWDDMIRKIDNFQLKRHNFSRLVEPMVWLYVPDVDHHFHSVFWDNYAKVFQNIWTASAYKGATGQSQYVVDISYHLKNHESWLKVMRRTHAKHYPQIQFQGIALTGWQRYDHTLPLCELLPVSLPSLASCLHCITHDGFTREVHGMVTQALKCKMELNLSPATKATDHAGCSFPGSEIYDAIAELKITREHVDEYVRLHMHDRNTHELIRKRVLSHVRIIPTILLALYDQDTVREFMQEQVVNRVSQMHKIKREAQTSIHQLYPWMKLPQGQM